MKETLIPMIIAGLSSPVIIWILNTLKESFSKTGLKQDIKEIKLVNKRLEIMQLIQHYPKEHKAICDAYDEYKKSGGNSYVDRVFNDWNNKNPQ